MSSDCIFYLTFSEKFFARFRNYLILLELRYATIQTNETTPKTAGIQDVACPDCVPIQIRKYP